MHYNTYYFIADRIIIYHNAAVFAPTLYKLDLIEDIYNMYMFDW